METSNPAKWLIPNLLDRRAETEPDRLYAEYPNSPWTYDEGFRGITYGELANAVMSTVLPLFSLTSWDLVIATYFLILGPTMSVMRL